VLVIRSGSKEQWRQIDAAYERPRMTPSAPGTRSCRPANYRRRYSSTAVALSLASIFCVCSPALGAEPATPTPSDGGNTVDQSGSLDGNDPSSTTTPSPSALPDEGSVTATGTARQTTATVGDCLGFSIDVTGIEHGVRLKPISEFLTGPYSGPPEPNQQATAGTVGQITAIWDGDEWTYSADCITVNDPGSYVWVVQNPNDETNGNDRSVHSGSVVNVASPQNPDPTNPTAATDTATINESTAKTQSTESGSPANASSSTTELAETGINGTNLAGVSGFALGAASVGCLALLLRRSARSKRAAVKRKESDK
jgi:hypothetical protein